MVKILDLQRNFGTHIYKKNHKKILDSLPYSNAEALERLAIYRNNIFGNFNSVLESIFEVTKKLVGDEFFEKLCQQFNQKYFSRSGNLDFYGSEFPQFLKKISIKHKLPYLPDVARLELDYHQAYFSKKVKDFDVKKFQKIAPEKFSNLTFELHPSCILLKSKFPIFSIWKDNVENKGRKKISLKNPEFVLISKGLGNVEIYKLSQEEFIFLNNLKQKKKLFETYKKIIRQTKSEFDIGRALNKFIAVRAISNFQLKESK